VGDLRTRGPLSYRGISLTRKEHSVLKFPANRKGIVRNISVLTVIVSVTL
jgi:hypothetical protein